MLLKISRLKKHEKNFARKIEENIETGIHKCNLSYVLCFLPFVVFVDPVVMNHIIAKSPKNIKFSRNQ